MPLRNLSIIVLAALVSLACYVRASRNRYVSTLAEAMNIISDEYVEEVDQRKLFEGAMQGMVEQLDDYSGYHPPDEYTQFQQDIDQEFVGIGVLVDYSQEKKELAVTPLVGTPAFKAGIRPGDVILAIDGFSTASLSLKDATDKIKGPAGSTVQLQVRHEGETTPVMVEVERASITVDSVLGDLRDESGAWSFRLAEEPRIGYIRITTFGERTADELRAALASYEEAGAGVEALVLDLRGNEGGLLDAAVDVCDMFLDEGVIVKTAGRRESERRTETASRGVEFDPSLPLVVMVDRFSASAAEIVPACLQDNKRAVVGGQRSWGKGTVQHVIQMEGGRSALRLTIARYLRPSGKNIHKAKGATDGDDWGVRPDEGLGLDLTEEQYQRWRRNRSQRDFLTMGGKFVWPQTKGETTQVPLTATPPMPTADDSAPATAPPPSGRSALDDDPQLQRVIDYLDQRLSEPGTPRRA